MTTPLACGFVERTTEKGKPGWWRPGWWGRVSDTKNGPMFKAEAEPHAREWPQAWGYGLVHVTRIDVCCDVEGFKFTDEHKTLFTGRGSYNPWFKRHELTTLNMGARESPLMLRIYLKSEHKHAHKEHKAWAQNGWSGGDVWRIEYEFHRKALPHGLVMPRDTAALWADGLARIRMCARNPRTYSQQNKADEHDVWKALGNPSRMTRRQGDLPGPSDETVRALELAQERLMVRAGSLMLPRLLAKITNAIKAAGYTGSDRLLSVEGPHGQEEKKEDE